MLPPCSFDGSFQFFTESNTNADSASSATFRTMFGSVTVHFLSVKLMFWTPIAPEPEINQWRQPHSPAAKPPQKWARVAFDLLVLQYEDGVCTKNFESGQSCTLFTQRPIEYMSFITLLKFFGEIVPTQCLERLRGYEQNLRSLSFHCWAAVFVSGDVLLVWLCFVGAIDATDRERLRERWEHWVSCLDDCDRCFHQ